MKLDGKTAIVTGGASGIGRATVLEFARAGATVFSGDIDTDGGARVAGEAGANASFLALDVADPGAIETFAAAVLERAPTVDVVVNVAGWDRIEPFMDNEPEFWDRVVAINLMGPVRVARAFLPAMIDGGAGKIVNVASDAGRVGSTGETMYAGAKGGVVAFTKSLAREMARFRINVNCVCPGPTDTPLFKAQPEKMRAALTKVIPFRRVAQPQEIANAILFFASARADYITGQVLSVSGGLTMVD
ncbi:MAG: SDR family NAD(P)-dependent oxidoreductase [Alphaproteobacteria bacterium]|jgi:2-hydroxycyclohexanecarboxyl-CoA dehydrogenase|nr:SDR family NAD(P)-dependent oxidoreductase [Alphaproteobacteria bacterium]MDP6516170.1 SDR family NAD(P)-dependent oxidoreductase [Alphaproteobacteria bacterium]